VGPGPKLTRVDRSSRSRAVVGELFAAAIEDFGYTFEN
jgi:hypothetical protein